VYCESWGGKNPTYEEEQWEHNSIENITYELKVFEAKGK
jgi:hypothetical protein